LDAVTPLRALFLPFRPFDARGLPHATPRAGPFADRAPGWLYLVALFGDAGLFQHRRVDGLVHGRYLHLAPSGIGMSFTLNTLSHLTVEIPISAHTARLPYRFASIGAFPPLRRHLGPLWLCHGAWSVAATARVDVRRDVVSPTVAAT